MVCVVHYEEAWVGKLKAIYMYMCINIADIRIRVCKRTCMCIRMCIHRLYIGVFIYVNEYGNVKVCLCDDGNI